jgi:hypothetical protein
MPQDRIRFSLCHLHLRNRDTTDNITLHWLTNTAIWSAPLYAENKLAFFAPKRVKIAVAVSAFPVARTSA